MPERARGSDGGAMDRGAVQVREREEAMGGASVDVLKHSSDRRWVGDNRQHAQCCAATRILVQVDVEYVARALHRAHRCPGVRRRGLVVLARGRRQRRRHDEATVA